MKTIIFSFLVSSVITYLIVSSKKIHGLLTLDHNVSGPQKFHRTPVPRVGGIAIFIGLILSVFIFKPMVSFPNSWMQLVIVTALPFFLIGFIEDILKKIGVKTRLLIIVISSFSACHFLNIRIYELHVPGIDLLLGVSFLSIIFTIFCVTGLTNAYNIIDGFNGLASMVGIMTLIAIGYVAFKVHDLDILYFSLIITGAILGFFFWNYPNGNIFLGDGGAYLIGFLVSILSITLVIKNPSVSPWFALAINGYAITETLFSIFRRLFFQKSNPGNADGLHFHSLIYRRRLLFSQDHKRVNSKTAELIWLISAASIIPGIIFWDNTNVLQFFYVFFVFTYISLYSWLINFKKRPL
jgi:UDP-N-acetylmuramyl pentapeptide phosphotransferase/UDP-N-acetylglucosamine-1-phosphate transferase